MEQQQQQQSENEQRAGDAGETGTDRALREMDEAIARQTQGKDMDQPVSGEIDMQILRLNARQFTELNKRLKAFFDQLRDEGVLDEETTFSVIAKCREQNSILDDLKKITREMEINEEALAAGAITPNQYLQRLAHIHKHLADHQEATKLFLSMAAGVDIDTQEGRDEMAAKVDELTKSQETNAPTHFSPEN